MPYTIAFITTPEQLEISSDTLGEYVLSPRKIIYFNKESGGRDLNNSLIGKIIFQIKSNDNHTVTVEGVLENDQSIFSSVTVPELPLLQDALEEAVKILSFEDTKPIASILDSITEDIKHKLFSEKCYVVSDTSFYGTGIIRSNKKIIGLFDQLFIHKDFTVSLIRNVKSFDLPRVKDLSVEFIPETQKNNKYKIVMKNLKFDDNFKQRALENNTYDYEIIRCNIKAVRVDDAETLDFSIPEYDNNNPNDYIERCLMLISNESDKNIAENTRNIVLSDEDEDFLFGID